MVMRGAARGLVVAFPHFSPRLRTGTQQHGCRTRPLHWRVSRNIRSTADFQPWSAVSQYRSGFGARTSDKATPHRHASVSSGMVEHEATWSMAIWNRSGQVKIKGNPLMRMLALAIVGSVAAASAMAQSAAVDVGVRADGTGGAGGNASSGQATIGTVSNTTSIQGPSGGAYTIRNTPGLGQAIAIAPCVVGVGAQGVGPGFGFGVSFGKEDYACTVRGNAALLAQMGYAQEALTYFAQEVPQIARAFAMVQQGRAATSQLIAAEAVAAPSYCRPLPYESVGDRLMREKNCRGIVGAAAEVGQRNRTLAGGQHRPAAVQLQRLANREARRALRGGRGNSHRPTDGKSA